MSALCVRKQWLVPVVAKLQELYPWLSKTVVHRQARDLIVDQRSGCNTHEEWVDMWESDYKPLQFNNTFLFPGQPPFKKQKKQKDKRAKKQKKTPKNTPNKKRPAASVFDDVLVYDPIEVASD